MTSPGHVVAVLVAAGGAAWEPDVLREIELSPSMRLARRCVDVADLLALGESADAHAAVVAVGMPGLDVDAVVRLERAGIRVVGIGDDERRIALGIGARAEPGVVARAVAGAGREPAESAVSQADGRVVAVWGPSGAPGRSIIAGSVAAAFAHHDLETVLVDADTYGGSQGQMLAMLDEVSGLMAACRAANQGRVDESTDHLLDVESRLRLLTGIPRSDLWSQVRQGAFERVLRHLQGVADVVVADCAASLDADDGHAGAGRNHVSRHLLTRADAVLVVGRADPIGLSRLVRSLHVLTDVIDAQPIVAVNLMRPSLGWSQREVGATLARLTGIEPAVFVPADVEAVDLAVMRGRLPRHVAPSSPFVRAIDDLAAALLPVIRSARAPEFASS